MFNDKSSLHTSALCTSSVETQLAASQDKQGTLVETHLAASQSSGPVLLFTLYFMNCHPEAERRSKATER